MARWRVEGLHRSRGERIAVNIEAPTKAEAEQLVGMRGVNVDPSCTRLADGEVAMNPPPPDKPFYVRYAWAFLTAAPVWFIAGIIIVAALRTEIQIDRWMVMWGQTIPAVVLIGFGLAGFRDRIGTLLLPSRRPSQHAPRRERVSRGALIAIWFYALIGWVIVGSLLVTGLRGMGFGGETLIVVRAGIVLSGMGALVLALIGSWHAFKQQQDDFARAAHAADLHEIGEVAAGTPGIAAVHAMTRRPGWHEMQHTALAVMLGMWAWSISLMIVAIGLILAVMWFGGLSGLFRGN